jgi:hypothetical protein
MMTPSTDLKNHVVLKAVGGPLSTGAPLAVIAGGTGDSTAVTGLTVDRSGHDSAVLAVFCQAKLTTSETFSLQMEYQTSADDSNWDTAVVLQASTVALTATGSTVVSYGLNLTGLKRYIRLNFTPDFSKATVDTAVAQGAVILAGGRSLPAV